MLFCFTWQVGDSKVIEALQRALFVLY